MLDIASITNVTPLQVRITIMVSTIAKLRVYGFDLVVDIGQGG